MKTSVIGYPRIGSLRELKSERRNYCRRQQNFGSSIGTRRKKQGLILFPVMIFRFMIWFWTQQFCWELCQRDIRS